MDPWASWPTSESSGALARLGLGTREVEEELVNMGETRVEGLPPTPTKHWVKNKSSAQCPYHRLQGW
jgi:hypothetical protein